jgi:hypothetical protein
MVPADIAAVRPIDVEAVTGGCGVSKLNRTPRLKAQCARRVKGLLYDAVRWFTSDGSVAPAVAARIGS